MIEQNIPLINQKVKKESRFVDPVMKEIHLHYPHKHNSTIIPSGIITAPYAQEIRDRKIERIDVFFN